MPMQTFLIYTDGGARGNPGPAGSGAVIMDPRGAVLKEISKPLGIQTNNYAEYTAVIEALKELKKIVPKDARKETLVDIRMDSELVVRQLSGVYQIKNEGLGPLFLEIHNMRVSDFPRMTFTHVPRKENKLADRLANEAMDAVEAKGSLFRTQ